MGPTIMSHMHHIDGLSTAAAQYQAYLERMRVAHKDDEGEKKVRRKNEGKKFQEHLEPEEEDSKEKPEENPSEGGEETSEQEASPGDGFGNHYA